MNKKTVVWLAILGFILLAILCICNNRNKIETDIRARSLAAISEIEGFEGDIDISGRDVTINGTVKTDKLKLRIEQLIGSERGVRKVFNNIIVELPLETIDEKLTEKQEELDKIIEFDNIEFQWDSAIILPEPLIIIDQAARILKENPDIYIELSGHADSTGNEEYNIGLSKRRAEAVLSQLVYSDILKSRLTAKGYGSSQSIADNRTLEGQQKNRRVEFNILEEK
ncbi:MAG: OmpA family protein [Candidatus Marinimicrobia bacterium]|nr:OmpA family protein [Candidatus Neomarinimicrobiota bacterium]